MKFLLPYRFKRAGSVMAPLGFIMWLALQRGLISWLIEKVPALSWMDGEVRYHWVVVLLFAISFFSFLFGLYFLAFSREKVEDEMVRALRLESFQFAALLQLAVIIASFLFMVVAHKEPDGDFGLSLFFLFGLVLFWISFIARFHYVLYRRARLQG